MNTRGTGRAGRAGRAARGRTGRVCFTFLVRHLLRKYQASVLCTGQMISYNELLFLDKDSAFAGMEATRQSLHFGVC